MLCCRLTTAAASLMAKSGCQVGLPELLCGNASSSTRTGSTCGRLRCPNEFICPVAEAVWDGTCRMPGGSAAPANTRHPLPPTIFKKTRTPLTVWFGCGLAAGEQQDRQLGHPSPSRDGAWLDPDCIAASIPHGDGPALTVPPTWRRGGR